MTNVLHLAPSLALVVGLCQVIAIKTPLIRLFDIITLPCIIVWHTQISMFPQFLHRKFSEEHFMAWIVNVYGQ